MRISDWSSDVCSSDLAGDAGGLLQQVAAVLRLGIDDGADAALAHQRRRMGAGGGVGEQELHVAGAHVLAVHPVDRAGTPLDAAHHLDLVERSEEHTSELQSLMRTSYAVFCLKKKNTLTYNSP